MVCGQCGENVVKAVGMELRHVTGLPSDHWRKVKILVQSSQWIKECAAMIALVRIVFFCHYKIFIFRKNLDLEGNSDLQNVFYFERVIFITAIS